MNNYLKKTALGTELFVKVTPKSGKDLVVGVEGDRLKVRLKAAPEKGNANEALIKTLAEFFNLPLSKVEILSGSTSRLKRVLLKDYDGQIIDKVATL